ncbi:MAG: NUDIX domain-containing protein [Candidatus Peribacteria bacterium]|nr:NUDIX domain-containing protein [Candidatus Peribacteria bacterium]
MEDGETPEQTLIREMKEELNINVTVQELLKEYDNIDL